ncbi:hypothetical protein COY07_04380 [Candidatus Peregrinibacteria bacterium CG_4_10_14_0_2_um_filter_43_11]|nr:MAG: hypothetical protein COY07_04380 [Candidatus Peregrinibacteria bacterium CG_4_10_14_0_2_um_filter_43_11]
MLKQWIITGMLGMGLLVAPLSVAHALGTAGLNNHFPINAGIQEINPLTIIMNESSDSITLKQGINLILSDVQYILWEKDNEDIQITGSAVDNGKILAKPAVTYSTNLKSLHLPIEADWVVGDEITISGLKVRIYDRASGNHIVGIDLNGDNLKDFDSTMAIRIDEDSPRSDLTPPYPPQNVVATVLENPFRVQLTWVTPPDYDFRTFGLQKTFVSTGEKVFLFDSSEKTEYIDTQVKFGDEIRYDVYARDRRNESSVAITVHVVAPSSNPETPPVENPVDPSTVTPEAPVVETSPETEVDLLTRLFTYYRVRYQIKCSKNADDSACLWAKINVLYAQEKLSRSDIATSLSARDLKLMGIRTPFSQKRYQENCIEAQQAAPYCASLKRALDRANYFLTN